MSEIVRNFPFFRQTGAKDCGPLCIRMIASYYGKNYTLEFLKQNVSIDSEGISLLDISKTAEAIGMDVVAVNLPFITYEENRDEASLQDATFPCIAFLKQNHFVVIVRANKKYVWIVDPNVGKHKMTKVNFEADWATNNGKGVILILEPSFSFYEFEEK